MSMHLRAVEDEELKAMAREQNCLSRETPLDDHMTAIVYCELGLTALCPLAATP